MRNRKCKEGFIMTPDGNCKPPLGAVMPDWMKKERLRKPQPSEQMKQGGNIGPGFDCRNHWTDCPPNTYCNMSTGQCDKSGPPKPQPRGSHGNSVQYKALTRTYPSSPNVNDKYKIIRADGSMDGNRDTIMHWQSGGGQCHSFTRGGSNANPSTAWDHNAHECDNYCLNREATISAMYPQCSSGCAWDTTQADGVSIIDFGNTTCAYHTCGGSMQSGCDSFPASGGYCHPECHTYGDTCMSAGWQPEDNLCYSTCWPCGSACLTMANASWGGGTCNDATQMIANYCDQGYAATCGPVQQGGGCHCRYYCTDCAAPPPPPGPPPPGPPPPPGGCFVADTMVSTPSGDIAIQNLKVGDLVNSFIDHDDQVTTSVISALVSHDPSEDSYGLYELGTKNNRVTVTGNHPFVLEDVDGPAWVMIVDLEVDDNIYVETGELETIISLEKLDHKESTYNLMVDTTHTYIADGFRVHNSYYDDVLKRQTAARRSNIKRRKPGRRKFRNGHQPRPGPRPKIVT